MSRALPPELAALMARQGGAVLRPQALDHGVWPQDELRSGRWVWVRRGTYADAELWAGLDEWHGRPQLRARAATLRMSRAWALSHDSAALEHGLPLLDPRACLVHVTRPGVTNAWTKAGVKHHLARFHREQVVEIDGRRVLDIPRTAVDLAREHGFAAGVVAADAALRRSVPRSALVAAYEPTMRNWPGITQVRRAVEFADAGAATPHESLGRILVHEVGYGRPETQFPVVTPRGVVYCDLRVGNHVIETDGRVKYRSRDRGGLADKPADEVVWDEKVRERLLRDEGLGVSRLFWEDHFGARRVEAIRRLRRDISDTIAARGLVLDPRLERQAAELRVRHGA